MEKKLISIIIPIYNVEKYLDKCIESVVNQTYKNLEIILVDDGSSDRCPEMCDEWAKKDNRIKVIHKTNGGLSDARNYGIDACTGDYIMFLDSDDYVDFNICTKLYELIDKFDADFSMCDAYKFFEDEPINNENIVDEEVKCFEGENVLNQLFHQTAKYLVVAWAKLYKKEIFKEIRYPKGKLHEDEFVIHKVLSRVNKFVYTNEKLYYYLQRNSSITGSNISERNLENTLQAFEDRYNYLIDRNLAIVNNSLHMMGNLRNLYCRAKKYKFKIKDEILKKYKTIYKNAPKKSWKDILFRRFNLVYMILIKLKGN